MRDRRYGSPRPLRGAHDQRLCPPDQIAKLRSVCLLVDAGHRPGKAVGRAPKDLARLGQKLNNSQRPVVSADGQEVLPLLVAYDVDSLCQFLTSSPIRFGLRAFACDIGPGLAQEIGAAWSRGAQQIHQEHLFAERFTGVLHSAIIAVPDARTPCNRPRVPVSTFPPKLHALGLLMAETLVVLEDCTCTCSGVKLPVFGTAIATEAYKVDILALPFPAIARSRQSGAGGAFGASCGSFQVSGNLRGRCLRWTGMEAGYLGSRGAICH